MTFVFVSHSERDGEGAQLVRDRLVQSLERQGHRVWLDKHRIDLGDEWEAKILSGLTACDLGVVLLGAQTVADPGYVLKEATIFAYRRYLEPDFQFVTIVLDPGVESALDRGRLWRPVQLKRWQQLSAVDRPVEDVVSEIVGCAERMTRIAERELDEGVQVLVSLLEALGNKYPFSLAGLVRELGLFDSPYSDEDLSERQVWKRCSGELGARLLATDARELPPILEMLPPEEERQRLGGLLAANWVPVDIAATVRLASLSAKSASVAVSVGMTGDWDPDTSVVVMASDIIDRARRSRMYANYTLLIADELLDEATSESPEALAASIIARLFAGVPASATAADRVDWVRTRRFHVLLRALNTVDLALFQAAVDQVIASVGKHVLFLLIVDPAITDEVLSVDESPGTCWVRRQLVLFASQTPGATS